MATAIDPTTRAAAHDGIAVGEPPIVDITALRKSYGSNEVLKGIDLKVQRGEVIAIIGKSGSGKSTLLRCVNGLEEFQEGALSVNGQKLLHDSPTEPPRVLRRLQHLRRWSYDQVKQVLTRGPRARRAHGAGASSRLPIAVGSH